ncbi:tRNA pseudouridine synthase B [Ceratocystis fimbriata CBS 114723]|uniref:tRNA pseudouridine(55) synthase n=1 Tax=Ceratocystis fimbriata CBS 114723 TaxID=1035309 RepID=A0A2C5X507_9PEZI|nr:tRNA pseudouridine synthase B [Ceratocystis fimbriata CBS 114723]
MRFKSPPIYNMTTQKVVEGVFGINKPLGMSSAQVIRDAQQQLNPSKMFAPWIKQEKEKRAVESHSQQKRRRQVKREIQVKMGHGGTLDPLATGVLILGVGSGTKCLQSFLKCTKTYETIVLFGASTDTYDRSGRVLMRRPYEHITKEAVLKAVDEFRGTIKQVPPLYSALKMEGKPLYEYAREGKPIPREIPTREVEVKELELLEYYEPGTHKFRWPREQADAAETRLAQQVWKLEGEDIDSAAATQESEASSEEEIRESEALAAHEATKRRFEESVDELVRDCPSRKKRRFEKSSGRSQVPMMSGALNGHPETAEKASESKKDKKDRKNTPNNQNSDPSRGHNLVPEVDESLPPPWEGKGPAAARIRLTVTSGFYVRSFCHDLGIKLGSVALMSELCRSRQGDFKLNTPSVLEYSDLMKGEEVWAPKIEAMLRQWEEKHSPSPKMAPGKTEHVETDQKPEPAKVVAPIKPETATGASERTIQDDEKSWNGIED